jgi:hypothetical protein
MNRREFIRNLTLAGLGLKVGFSQDISKSLFIQKWENHLSILLDQIGFKGKQKRELMKSIVHLGIDLSKFQNKSIKNVFNSQFFKL